MLPDEEQLPRKYALFAIFAFFLLDLRGCLGLGSEGERDEIYFVSRFARVGWSRCRF